MNRLIQHARSNAIAYLALIVALSGTSYAAINLPSGSVGAPQIKNHSITPIKLDPTKIAGSVRYWAQISDKGTIIASRPRAQISGWQARFASGLISWHERFPAGCFALATVADTNGGVVAGGGGFATVRTYTNVPPQNPLAKKANFATFNLSGQPTPEPVNLAVVCPQP